MAKRKRNMRVTAAVVMAEMAAAESGYEAPPKGKREIHVKPREVEFWPELFQPRKFSEGAYEVDEGHVKELAQRIVRKGELDPITVIRIFGRWYCVDGHHRIAGYRKQKWKSPIKANWFAGTIQEAMDHSVECNEVAKLPVNNSDKREEAWRRVVMGRGSKSQIVYFTGASDGTVGKMRRVWKAYNNQTPRGRELKRRVGDIARSMWTSVQQAWDNTEPGMFDVEAAAETLARTINRRLTDKLRENVEVTARALWHYDREMCTRLVRELARVIEEKAAEEAENDRLAELRHRGYETEDT